MLEGTADMDHSSNEFHAIKLDDNNPFKNEPGSPQSTQETDNDKEDEDVDMESSEGEMKDDGATLLYPNVSNNFPMKTADRLIDDILCDPSYLYDFVSQDTDHDNPTVGLLTTTPLSYSHKRQNMDTLTFGTFIDQLMLKTKYEYKSKSCPTHNDIKVLYGVLLNSKPQLESLDDVIDTPLYHVKISVKSRKILETRKKQVGITHFHLIEELHPFDKEDFPLFKSDNPKLIDHAIYTSNDTNRLVIIEIFKAEFLDDADRSYFKTVTINNNYQEACKSLQTLDPSIIITPPDCYNVLFKLFRGPLSRLTASDGIKTIDSNNVSLNSHVNPEWLITKYSFTKDVITAQDTGEVSNVYTPPDLTAYDSDLAVADMRDTYIRCCMELGFRGQLSIKIARQLGTDLLVKTSHALNALHTQLSSSGLYQILGESNSLRFQTNESSSPMDKNFHFINLSCNYYYSDRDIIRNYETFSSLDPENIGVYFDSLSFIANSKGAYQIVAYCGKQDIVGKEALDSALATFKIDPDNVNISEIDDNFLLSIYKSESRVASQNYLTDLKNAARTLAKYKKSDMLNFYIDHEPYHSLAQAYGALEIDESVDDDIIQTAYSIKINDMPGLKIDCDRALYTIGTKRRSMLLLNYLIEECPDFLRFYGPDRFSYQDAMNILHINENANDEVIINVFQQRWNDEPIVDPDQLLNLKAALTKLGMEKNSKLIGHFLETGTIDPNCLPPENWPTGLNNIGNTCYLNSLLQYYFSIAPLREYIINYQNTTLNFETMNNAIMEQRRIGGRIVAKSEVERSIQFIYQLRDLFQNMIYSQDRCVTPSQALAYLAFSPSNVEVEFEVAGESNDNQPNGSANKIDEDDVMTDTIAENGTPENPSLIDLDMPEPNDVDMTAGELSKCDEKAVIASSTRVAKISTDQLENALEMGRQQDVTECIGNVLYQLESASEPLSLDDDNEQNDLVKQLFYGKTKQEIIPLNDSSKVRTKYERFVSLLVNVSDHPRDIYDALDSSFEDEYLKMEEYGDVKRALSITTLPTILQVQIQRVYYDRERFMPFKSIEPVPFSDQLFMDRYVTSDDPVMLERKEETRKIKEELRGLRERQQQLLSRDAVGLSKKDTFIETSKFLSSTVLENEGIEIDSKRDMIDHLNGLTKAIDEELGCIFERITTLQNKLTHQYDSFKKIGYTLFAVFIHRGEASYGHYWVYVKDLKQHGTWRKYNDETVTEVNETEVFNFTEGNTATPYFLVFVKDENKDDIEPLKRIIDVANNV